MDLTELRALIVTTQSSVKRVLQNKSREITCGSSYFGASSKVTLILPRSVLRPIDSSRFSPTFLF